MSINKEAVVSRLNEIIKEKGYEGQIFITPDHIEIPQREEFIYWTNTKIDNRENSVKTGGNDQLFNFLHNEFQDQKDNNELHYLYLKTEYAKSILKNNEIQVSALHNFIKDDDQENIALYNYNVLLADPVGFKELVKEDRKNIFALCTTVMRDKDDMVFWNKYGDNRKGVALGLNIRPTEYMVDIWGFRDVLYGDCKPFELVREFQKRISDEFGKKFALYGFSKYSSFYKRDNFKDEREKRITFDYTVANQAFSVLASKHEGFFKIKDENDRIFIKVPLKNQLFEIVINEVIVGHLVPDEEIAELIRYVSKTTRVYRVGEEHTNLMSQ